jgi:hypothetical protein
MKVTEHVEHLLRQGWKPTELVELGFPKSVVTRVRRQLRDEKAAQGAGTGTAAPRGVGSAQPSAVSPKTMTAVDQRLASLEGEIDKLTGRMETLEAASVALKNIEVRLEGTPALGLRHRFKCDCGASGFVAVRIECTKCGRETWWGWFPNR